MPPENGDSAKKERLAEAKQMMQAAQALFNSGRPSRSQQIFDAAVAIYIEKDVMTPEAAVDAATKIHEACFGKQEIPDGI